ncbi:hypothetical protein TNCV_400281 [Trichonephila clavipes]|nr:hypothetical protein TNCV_400281 [Trichonephila clavipes]
MGGIGSALNGLRDTRCSPAMRLSMVPENTEACHVGAVFCLDSYQLGSWLYACVSYVETVFSTIVLSRAF